MQRTESSIRIFTTCPPYGGSPPNEYVDHVRNVARWSDGAGCEGILVYTDNSTVDPWLLSQTIIQSTRALAPLVAVQPVYMHPYAVAKAVSTLAYFHGRRVCMNMVAGGFKNDLTALNDLTPHERRYDRLVEYTTIIKRLLAGDGPVTFTGHFYTVHQLALKPPLPSELFPTITISGSSPEGLAAARVLEAIPVKYPEPAGESGAEVPGGPIEEAAHIAMCDDDAFGRSGGARSEENVSGVVFGARGGGLGRGPGQAIAPAEGDPEPLFPRFGGSEPAYPDRALRVRA
jgi:hypothetical protein